MNKNEKGFSAVEGLIILLVAALIGAVGYVVYKHQHKTDYQSVVNSFITDVQKKDKKDADSLESSSFQSYSKKISGNTSFYSGCQQIGQLCMPLFDSSFINNATKTYKDYKSSGGVAGKTVIYTLKQTLTGTQAGGQDCVSTSVNTLVISVVPNGGNWQVDNVSPSITASAKLCPAAGSSSTVSSSTPAQSTPSSSSKATSNTKSSAPMPSSKNPSPAPAAPQGTVLVSNDGCYVAAWGSPGMTLTISVQKAGGGGGQASYTIPAAGAIEEPSGGYQNETTTGTLYQSGTVVATNSATVTAASCPAGS